METQLLGRGRGVGKIEKKSFLSWGKTSLLPSREKKGSGTMKMDLKWFEESADNQQNGGISPFFMRYEVGKNSEGP